jgi:ectoine hydroxylase-related dioxygenase (phytanoyl-CoA dioxygenase family)
MNQDLRTGRPDPNWYREPDCSLAEFASLVETGPQGDTPAFAARVQSRVPVYEGDALRPMLRDENARSLLLAEWARLLHRGAGVFVLRAAYADTAPIDAATAVFDAIIRDEREAGKTGADHFAKAGANDRIWNAHEKLCLRAPGVFARYYANPVIAAAVEAWLGPAYQVTAQVNVVRPGGQAQEAHRDYHLGFQSASEAARYPAHVHAMSPFLTLQGAVAHGDMPVESGPTKLLPYSQRYAEGYLAWRRQDFRDYFETHCVQLPLDKGDALFFNPAIFHAAGANRTADVNRMANLLQISSAYGRAMETLDRDAMCEALYPHLRECRASAAMSGDEADAVIAACAEGYPFPTSLDRDPPVGGLAPESQQALMRRALDAQWPVEAFVDALRRQSQRRAAR